MTAACFTLFEYVRTLSPFGLSYGVAGYSQWSVFPLIQGASLFGVWGITFCIYLFNALIFFIIQKQNSILSLFLTFLFFILFNTAGFFNIKDNNTSFFKVLLVQSCADPWKEGIEEYRREYYSLKELTDKGMVSECDLAVWSETAIVPDIIRHKDNTSDKARHEFSLEVCDYLSSLPSAILTGSNYKNYNSVLLFNADKKGYNDHYDKIHLVPFTETSPFPFKSRLTDKLYDSLDAHFYDRGSEVKNFSVKGVKIVTPVCFEDTDALLVRKMKKRGADLIVNLTNDYWSKSVVCQYQHLQNAVFRSVEEGIPSVRSTVSGQTCYIDRHGRIREMASPLCKNTLLCNVEVTQSSSFTLYNLWGDLLCYILFASVFIRFIFIVILEKKVHIG